MHKTMVMSVADLAKLVANKFINLFVKEKEKLNYKQIDAITKCLW